MDADIGFGMLPRLVTGMAALLVASLVKPMKPQMSIMMMWGVILIHPKKSNTNQKRTHNNRQAALTVAAA